MFRNKLIGAGLCGVLALSYGCRRAADSEAIGALKPKAGLEIKASEPYADIGADTIGPEMNCSGKAEPETRRIENEQLPGFGEKQKNMHLAGIVDLKDRIEKPEGKEHGKLPPFERKRRQWATEAEYLDYRRISLEQARADKNLRQGYLDQIGAELEIDIQYDPDFESASELVRKKIKTADDGKHIPAVTIGKRLSEDKAWKRIYVYGSRLCFEEDVAETEDEVKSLFDHEKAHADIMRNGFDIKYPVTEEESDEVTKNAFELICYGAQLSKIFEGERNVSKEFLESCLRNYLNLKSYLLERVIDGRYAENILETIKSGKKDIENKKR